MIQALSAAADLCLGKTGYVIGNGPGRLRHDLKEVVGGAVSIGCNLLINDFVPSYCVAVDGPAAQAIWDADVCPIFVPAHGSRRRKYPAYFWQSTSIFNAETLGSQFRLTDRFVKGISGVIALQAAILLGCDPIILVGMEHSLEPETRNHSIYFGQGHHIYDQVGPIGLGPTTKVGAETVPLSWLDSIARIWWIAHRYGRTRRILRIDSRGVLNFLPTVAEGARPIEPIPTINLEEFRRVFPNHPCHELRAVHPGSASASSG